MAAGAETLCSPTVHSTDFSGVQRARGRSSTAGSKRQIVPVIHWTRSTVEESPTMTQGTVTRQSALEIFAVPGPSSLTVRQDDPDPTWRWPCPFWWPYSISSSSICRLSVMPLIRLTESPPGSRCSRARMDSGLLTNAGRSQRGSSKVLNASSPGHSGCLSVSRVASAIQSCPLLSKLQLVAASSRGCSCGVAQP